MDACALACIRSIMDILDPVMPIAKIKLKLKLGFHDDLNGSRYVAVMNDIAANFRWERDVL